MNQKGTVLQVTLMMLVIIIFNILTLFNTCIIKAKALKRVETIDKQRLLETMLIAYFKEESKNSILLSDEYTMDNVCVKYTVDDMGDEYEINVYESLNNNIKIKVLLDKNHHKINGINYESK